MQIKTTITPHTRQAHTAQKNREEQALMKMRGNCDPHTLLAGMSNGEAACKTGWWILQKLSTELRYDSAILVLGVYSKELKTGAQISTCTCVHNSNNHNCQKVEIA